MADRLNPDGTVNLGGDAQLTPVVDFDSRRNARDTAAAVERAEQQRKRLAESRATHAPLSREQSNATRAHRNDTTARAEAHRNVMRIVNCGLCDDNGYRGTVVCDHIDHGPANRRGIALVREQLKRRPRNSRSENRQRTELVGVRFLPDEHQALVAAAAGAGVGLSEFVRDAAIRAAQSDSKDGR